MWLLFACSEPPSPAPTPEAHSWKEEGELVIAGLEEVKSLWKAGQHEAARTFAERVYTERWEPQLERAVVKMSAPEERDRLEYAFGLLMVDLDRNAPGVPDRILKLEGEVRTVADAAARAFPPLESAGQPPPPAPAGDGARPIVPDVKPAWEQPG